MAGSRRKYQVVILLLLLLVPGVSVLSLLLQNRGYNTPFVFLKTCDLLRGVVTCRDGIIHTGVSLLLCFLLQNQLQVSSLLRCPGSSQGNSLRKLLLPCKCIFF